MRTAALVIALVVLGAGAAHAQRAEREAKRLFTQGNRAFDEARYSDALAAYRASFDLVARPSTLFNIATCRDRLGDLEAAWVDYSRFVATAEAKDAALVTRAKTRLDELRASMRLPVQVTSSPPGAAIRVGDADVIAARTPATLTLPMGTHAIHLQAPMHRAADRTVEVVPGQRAAVDVALDPLAALAITAEPGDAAIVLDDDRTAQGRLALEVEPGAHRVVVRRDGYRDATVELTVIGGETASRHVVLERVAPVPAPALTAATTSPPEPARGGRGLRYGGLAVGAAGLLAVAIGVQQGLSASGRSDDAQDAAGEGRFDADAYDDAQDAEQRAIVLSIAGAGAIATGVVLYWLGWRF